MTRNTKKPRAGYSEEAMKKAVDAVKSGTAINEASRKYKIPRSSLHAKVTKKYASDKGGPDPILSKVEENTLEDWINFVCSFKHPVKKNHVILSAELLIKKSKRQNSFTGGRPGRHWYEGFYRRHKGLKSKIRENNRLSKEAIDNDGIKSWFAKIEHCLRKEKLTDVDSARVFNVGETALSFDPITGFGLTNEGKKIQRKTAEEVTILLSGNAAGLTGPTMVVFDSQEIPKNINERLSRDWTIVASAGERMTAELFYEYIVDWFYPWLLRNKVELPVILYLDKVTSYLSSLLYEFCCKNQIILFILPMHTTHFMQPMYAVMSLLKSRWKKNVNSLKRRANHLRINKGDVLPLLQKAFDSINFDEMLKSSFRKCGLYPLSSNDVDYTKICTSLKETENTEKTEETKETEKIEQQSTKQPTSNQESLLESIEKYIDAATLETFRFHKDSNKWTGKIEDSTMFYVWKRILENCPAEKINVEPPKENVEKVIQQIDPCIDYTPLLMDPILLDNLENLISLNQCVDNVSSVEPFQYLNQTEEMQKYNLSLSVIVVNPNDIIMETDSDGLYNEN